MYAFSLIDRDGQILETFTTAEQRWAAGDTVIAHGNRCYRVVSVIPVERMSEFGSTSLPAACLKLNRCRKSGRRSAEQIPARRN